MAGWFPTHYGIQKHPQHQHERPDQVTTLLPQLLPDPKRDQRYSILLSLYQSILTSHTTVTNVPSARSLVTISTPTSKSM